MSDNKRRLTYLSDIDGLRAIAVLAVVLFHLKIAGFAGGYVGVDIFFVISGSLISGSIRDRVQTGVTSAFSHSCRRYAACFQPYWQRWSSQSLPHFLLQPDALGPFALSAAACRDSVPPILLFYFESGYWDASAELKPLLHLWSLGVEEQFYLFWPAVIVICLATAPRSLAYRWGLFGNCFCSASPLCISLHSHPIAQQAFIFYLSGSGNLRWVLSL